MPEVMALSCPVCAAPLKPGSERCTYCGSYIFIKVDLPKLDRHTLNQAVIREHIEDFRNRLRANTYDEEAHYGLGLAYFNLGLVDEAVDELKQAAKLTPENPHIQAQLAIVLHEQFKDGNTAAAKERDSRIERALLLDPKNLEAQLLQAQMYSEFGNYDRTARLLRQIMDDDPDRAKPLLISAVKEQGEASLKRKDWQGARHAWEGLAELDPEASKKLMVSFLKINEELVPDWVQPTGTIPKQEAPKTLPKPSEKPITSSRRVWMTIVAVFISCMAFGIAGAILEPIMPKDSADEVTGWGSTVLGILGFTMTVVAIGVGIWAWRHYSPNARKTTQLPADSRPGRARPKSSAPQSGRIMRNEIVAGQAELSVIKYAANEVLAKLHV